MAKQTTPRQQKDSLLSDALNRAMARPPLDPGGSMWAELPPPPPQAAPAPMETIESGLLGAPTGAPGGAGEYGSDAWALNTGGPGASLWRAIASGGVYNALDWAGKNPGALESNDTILKAAKKELG